MRNGSALFRATAIGLLASFSAVAQGGPPHYNDAQNLITALLSNTANTNIYDADGTLTDRIDWSGNPRTAITVCSTFVTLLFKHTYGYSDSAFKTKFGSTSPTAARYYDDIAAGKGFTAVANAGFLVPGDIIAIKYPSGSNTTGHVMMVQSLAAYQPRIYSTQDFLANGAYPQIAGFYDVTVIDSSASYHGKTDTRYGKPGGIGRNGIFRIYVDSQTKIIGYTWSTFNNSEYRDAASYLVGLGRLKP